MGMVPKPRLRDCSSCGAHPHHMGPGLDCCELCEHPLQSRQTWLGRYAVLQ